MEQGRQNINRLSITIGIACFLWMLNFLGITPFYPFIAEDLNTPVALVGQITALIAIISIPGCVYKVVDVEMPQLLC